VTVKAGSARFSLTGSIKGTKFTGDGFLDLKQRRGKINVNLPGGIGTIEEIIQGTTFYIHVPESAQGRIPGHKPWLKVDLNKAASAQGLNLGALQSTSSNDPSQTLQQLRGVADVRKIGTDTVRGETATHYSAVIDLRRAANRAPAAQRAEAKRSINRLIQLLGRSTIPVQVWLDSQGRLVREFISLPLPQGDVKTTIELYDFGASEDVSPPPADQTADLSTLHQQRSGSTGG
jgi:hypothetical protein